MRTPQQVWDATCDDSRWLEEQTEILAEIMREAFAAGFAEGASSAARGIDGHAERLKLHPELQIPPSVAMGLRSLAQVARELGVDPVAVAAAWKRTGAQAPKRGSAA